MEIIIVICLLIVIALLLQDKIVIYKRSEQKPAQEKVNPNLPDIMGQPKPVRSLSMPNSANESQKQNAEQNSDNFEKEGSDINIPQEMEEPDEVFDIEEDLLDDVEESYAGEPNGVEEDSFARGVTFAELSSLKEHLQKDQLNTVDHQKASVIIEKVKGTELFELLENSIENASQRIARLLDRGLDMATDSGSSSLRKKDPKDFNIDDFL